MINYTNTNTTIRLWAPFAESVVLALQEDRLDLVKKEFGYWFAETNRIKPGDQYYFLIDGKRLPDPASLAQPGGVHGASQVVDLHSFKWNDQLWENIPLDQYILYELHTGTFTTEGTFSGIEDKLDHLIDLGITAIELMPVAQFPGDRNWGYDGVYPFAVQFSYGGAGGLQHLVNACHEKGLAVILDVVYNHMGPEGNYFGEFGPYFTDKYKTPWGSAINYDDAWCDGVRDYMIENVLMWFRDFHIDALRMDAVHAIKDFGARHILLQIRQTVDELMAVTGRTYYLIVESDLNDPRYIDPVTKRGFGMDAQWIDEFHHALRVTAGEKQTGYYSDFKGLDHLEKAYKDAYVYDGIYSPHRQKVFGCKADKNPGQQFVVFSQNHDQVGNRMMGERSSMLYTFEMQKLMAAAVLCSPFLPMLFMGEEWGETNPFLYFISHTDPDLIKAVQKGRKEEFAAFHNQGEVPDPQSEWTFNQSKLQWDLIKVQPHSVMFHYYKALIKLRRQHPALGNTNRNNTQVKRDPVSGCLILFRSHEDEIAVCLLNFSAKQQVLNFPADTSTWIKLFDSSDPDWSGTLPAVTNVSAGQQIFIQPQSILIYLNSNDHV